MASNDIAVLAGELAQAIEVTMNSMATQEQRLEAYMACEKFKEYSPLCAQTGLYLVSNQFSPVVKHFGLQLMEHTVKFNWNKISQQEKLFVKESSMKLLSTGVGPAQDKSLLHIKDALSRIIVEMIKREWPQQWTSLLAELFDACLKGVSQTELVSLIFLRLVEDVAVLQTIESNTRRKDLYQALTVNMREIFDLFLRLIELNVSEFRTATTMGDQEKAQGHSRVVQIVLLTLTGFVEWVSIQHIMESNGKLMQILCILLTDLEFQVSAAECLSYITNRKGQLKDRKPLMLLFNDDAMRYIYQAVNHIDLWTNESYYQFLKKLTQVLFGLTTQVIALWGKEDSTFDDMTTPPPNFRTFLEIVLLFARHPSSNVTHGGALIWLQLLKHDGICKDPTFISYIPNMIQTIGPKIIKIPYPKSRPTKLSLIPESFASLDYDSEDEYLVFMSRFRTDLLEIFRQSTLICPLLTFSYCEQWLMQRLRMSMSEANTTCSISDPVYLEWEAVVAVIDGVLSRILLVTERPSVLSGLNLLEECLKVHSNDPLILSILLSCISSLFVFLSMSSAGNVALTGAQLLPRVLEKIFSSFVFTVPGTDNNQIRSAAVKNLRRHAASSVVKIALKYPLLLLPIFDQINSTIQTLILQENQLTSLEKITLQEALLIISNHFCDFERQTTFIGEIISPTLLVWNEVSGVLKSADLFIKYIGMQDVASCNSLYVNRTNILKALNTVLGVVKRCNCPDDPDKAYRGGFIVAQTESGNPITRNPATPHVVSLLPHILSLLRILNELWLPASQSITGPDFKNANSMLDNEKKAVLGLSYIAPDPMDPIQQIATKTPFDYMQQFLSTLFEHSYHLMGAASTSLGRDLYALPGLANALINSAFSSLENVPDFRLRTIVRVFLKPFVYACPTSFYDTVLLPVFAHVAPFMLNRLTTRWEYIRSLYENGALGEDTNNDAQEVLEDILNRTLTREYLDVLKVALVGGSANVHQDNTDNDTIMDHDELSMDGVPHMTRAAQSAMQSDIISDIGKKLLCVHPTCVALVTVIFNSVSWNDSNSSLKATLLGGPVVRQLASDNLITEPLAEVILVRVLQGLQLHGQHEANQASLITLGVQVYEILRPKFSHLVLGIMQQIPNLVISDLNKLDEKILNGINPLANSNQSLSTAQPIPATTTSTKSSKIDKNKKDLFKKITSHLIGRSIGQLFRKEVVIRDLPRPASHRNLLNNNLLDHSVDTGVKELFTS